MRSGYQITKRAMDIGIASFGLLLTSPIVIASAIAVRLDSRGPVLFKSPRVGLGRKPFNLYKLRTMRFDDSGSGPQVTTGGDERITRVGRILRKTKIDELPQLINVLKGEVSLVGPRPEVPKYVELYPREYDRILSVKPGLSDRATLEFVGEEEILADSDDPEKTYIEEIMPRKLDHYLRYVDNHSLVEDLEVVVMTVCRIAGRILHSLRGKL